MAGLSKALGDVAVGAEAKARAGEAPASALGLIVGTLELLAWEPPLVTETCEAVWAL